MEAFSIAGAVVSIVLGAFAIWLSIVFYRMSVESSNRIQEASKDLSSSVNKLEKLFEHLYSDTFSMMRDTYSDMRKHVWPEVISKESEIVAQIEARADGKIDNIRRELMKQVEGLTAQAGGTDTKANELREELSPLIEDAISRSRNAETEAREETLRDLLIGRMKSTGPNGIVAVKLLDYVKDNAVINTREFLEELKRLKNEGIITFDSRGIAGPDESIFYTAESSGRRSKKETP